MKVVKAASPEAYELFHQGSIALAEIELNGIRIDTAYLDKMTASTTFEIKRLEAELMTDPLWARWRKKFRQKANFGSREQLASILFGDIGFPCHTYTASSYNSDGSLKDLESRRPKADESSLEAVDHPFPKKYIQVEKLKKVLSTYLGGIRREVLDGYLHPSFNLAGGGNEDDRGGARTYRSSSSHPNFQNIPVRNPEMAKIIRPCFISRPGYQLVEVDYSGIEVRIAYCYHKDPTMKKYLEDKTTDMHRDMAAQCYRIKESQVTKHPRYGAKNMFVFPQFYGSYYVDCARDLWEWANRAQLRIKLPADEKDPTGPLIIKHLAKKGIRELGACDPKQRPVPGTFEYHIKQVEDHFWNVRFPVYRDWKKKWFAEYIQNGGFRMYSGFWVSGVMKKNEVINYPVQGAAFHCLLWSLIRLHSIMKRRGMKSMIVGQIHDSILADVHTSELQDYLHLARKVMTEDLTRAWKWINIPLEIEAEVAPPDGSWFDKKEVPISA